MNIPDHDAPEMHFLFQHQSPCNGDLLLNHRKDHHVVLVPDLRNRIHLSADLHAEDFNPLVGERLLDKSLPFHRDRIDLDDVTEDPATGDDDFLVMKPERLIRLHFKSSRRFLL